MPVGAADIAMGLNLLVLVSLVIVLGLLFHNTSQAKSAAATAAVTRGLSQELRQSSDDLTRLIRTFCVTNNQTYWNYFKEVIDIRNGEAPLPSEPWRIWWDLLISDNKEPRPRTPPNSLLSRAVAAGFTADELGYLDAAKTLSDALIDVEDVAYNAMLGKFRAYPPGMAGLTPAQKSNFSIVGAPNQTYAVELVHGNLYHHWKGEIMRPLDMFAAVSSVRVDRKLDEINNLNDVLLGVLGASTGVLIIIMLLYIFKLRNDQETSQLLNAVLPAHISRSVTVSDVRLLREQASAQARSIRRQNNYTSSSAASTGTPKAQDLAGNGNIDVSSGSRFPVLFHEHIPILWIAFADVCSFTRICRVASCGAIISMLNELFALMDAACARFRIVKIKTIGDCFMSVKIPRLTNKAKTDSRNIARCGLDMLRFLFHSFDLVKTICLPFEDVAAMDDPDDLLPTDLELRAGLNAGECSSGVVGFDKFLYDVFGDTINTASRFESSGLPSHVHTSAQAMALLSEFSDLIDLVPEADGGVRRLNLKGVGDVDTVLISNVRAPEGEGGSTTDQNSQSYADLQSRGVSCSDKLTASAANASAPNKL